LDAGESQPNRINAMNSEWLHVPNIAKAKGPAEPAPGL